MRVRCRAIADVRSNALGALELECTPEGLWLRYESVSCYRDGYAPGPPALPSEHRVPWDRVRASRVGVELLRLEVQEPLSPFSCFLLRDFRRAEPQAWLARARAWSQVDAPRVVLAQLCEELSSHLGSPVPREEGGQELALSGRFRGSSAPPRSAVALLILACSAALAGVLLEKAPAYPPASATTSLVPPAATAAEPAATPSLQAPSSTPPPAPQRDALEQAELALLPAPALGGACECVRHESVLWQRPPPRLTAFVSQLEHRLHGAHRHLELEVTVINNGARALRGLRLGAQLSTLNEDPRDPDDDPVERTEYFPEPLPPGAQLSWRTEGRGDDFRLRIPDLGLLDEDGIDAAPAAAFLALAAGPPGFARLHGATMLAFLGYPQAREALLKVSEGSSEAERAHLERALQSTGSLRVCQLLVSSVGRATRTQSCLYNAAHVAQSDFELKVRALHLTRPSLTDPLGEIRVLAEETLIWSGTLAPRRGRRLDLTIDLSRAGSSPDHRLELLATARVGAE